MKKTTQQGPTVAVLSRISRQLNQQVEELVEAEGYVNKARLIEDAIRHFVESKKSQRLGDLPLAQVQN